MHNFIPHPPSVAIASPSPEAFAQRAQSYLSNAAQAGKSWFTATGDWTATSSPLITRERFWQCLAFYAQGKSETAALADAIVLSSPLDTGGYPFPTDFDIFHTNIAVMLLALYEDVMSPHAKARLEQAARAAFGFFPGDRAPDFQFHGYNDNMPAKAAMGLILGGERFGNDDAVRHGLWSLRQLAAQLSRRGINSEYNSPTYSPLTLHAMAEIASHARHPEARDLALNLETRLWIDIAARFHPETGVVAGPYSRAYTVDTLAHTSIMSTLLWLNLGDVVHPSPMELFNPGSPLVFHHRGNRPFNIAQMCWFAAGNYHIPAEAMRLFQGKSYPFSIVATAEAGDSGPDFPATPMRVQTHMEKDFTVGTASTGFLSGEQCMPYFVTYRQTETVETIRDVGTAFSKFVINGQRPGTVCTAGKGYSNAGEDDVLPGRSHTVTLQHGSTALVLTTPHLRLGGGADSPAGSETAPLSALEELIIFPSHFRKADEVRVGSSPRADWSGEVPRGEWIGCRRGRMLIAIRPLVYSRTLGVPSISLERANAYETIATRFHHGKERVFNRAELRHVFGGFIAEHAGVVDYPCLADFLEELAASQFTDFFQTTRRVRYRRPKGARRDALEMEISCTPGSPQPRFAEINRRPLAWPQLEISAFPSDPQFAIPFHGTNRAQVESWFPWDTLACAQADWPWAIGDRETAV